MQAFASGARRTLAIEDRGGILVRPKLVFPPFVGFGTRNKDGHTIGDIQTFFTLASCVSITLAAGPVWAALPDAVRINLPQV